MAKLKLILFTLLFSVIITSCYNDDNFRTVEVAVPEVLSKSEFRQTTEITTPEPINEVGKIYAYKDYIFVTETFKGIHVIDNSDPTNPFVAKFIKLLANEDVSVKNDYLYADSATDMVVFDISDINAIEQVERLEDVFDSYHFPENELVYDEVNWSNFNKEEDVIVGWSTVTEQREIVEQPEEDIIFETASSDSSGAETGQGGSLARFKIVEDYLYSVSSYEMFIFNISNLSEPVLANTQYTDWGIETIFYADDYLYLGGERGMYIYGINDPAAPTFISEFTHWEGCDPVVVDGDYAYLTLRGGNLCGQQESVLEVININDKYNPTLAERYTLENPYGLGFKENTLFVCDGTAGLKLFDKTNPVDLQLFEQYEDIQAKDVIPLENSLLMIGGNTLYQYKYVENGVELISEFVLK